MNWILWLKLGVWSYTSIHLGLFLLRKIYRLSDRFKRKHVVAHTWLLGCCYILLIMDILGILRMVTGSVTSVTEDIVALAGIVLSWTYLYFSPKVINRLEITKIKNNGNKYNG